MLVNSRPFAVERIKLISQCAIIARLYHASNIVDLERIGSNICCSIVINSVVLFISFHFIYVFGFSVSERESWTKHNETFIRRKWIQYMDFKCKSMPTIATLNDNIKNENDEFTPLFRYIDDRLGYRIGFIISLIRIHTHTHTFIMGFWWPPLRIVHTFHIGCSTILKLCLVSNLRAQ